MDGWEDGAGGSMSDGLGNGDDMFSRGGRTAFRSTKKFVSTLKDIPDTECWVIVSETSVHIPGDERSRTAPGHGYPEHTDNYVTVYEVFTNEEEFKIELAHEVKGASLLYSGTKLRGFKVTPYTTRTVVEVTSA